MEQLPQSLSYSASKQALRMNRFVCRPTGTDTASPGDTFRIKLPSKSLVNLSSFNLCFNLELSTLVDDANNFTNAKMPFSQSLFSSVRVYIGSQAVSGHLSNHYDLLYMGLVKASAGEDWCRSRYNDHARGLIENRDDITAFHTRPTATFTTKRGYYCMTDMLGAFRANGSKSIIDTSLWGDIDIEFTLNNASCIAKNAAGTALAADPAANARFVAAATADISYKIQDIEAYVECITQTTPLYVKLITMLLDSKEQIIRFPYQNFVSTIVQGGKNARLQVNSGCIDAMVVLPLHANYNNNKAIVGVEHDLSAQRYKFTACNSNGAPIVIATDNTAFNSVKGANMQIQIGSDTFPKIPIDNFLSVSDITTNSLFSNSLYSQNLLFNGNSDATNSGYSRQKFLSENFVWVQSFSDGEGWATKVLTGIDSASQNLDVIVNANTPLNGSLMIGALLTSLLVFDTRTGQVSVVQ
jgi:hypothetical protein